jgi:branched-subunit amino acid aminotransferase/4-amino-4-deoxychorismate lyase
MFALLNEKILKNEEASKFSRGYGIFDTMLYADGQLHEPTVHLNRLSNSLKALGLAAHLPSEEYLHEVAQKLFALNTINKGALRIANTKHPDSEETMLTIEVRPFAYRPELYCRGLKVCFRLKDRSTTGQHDLKLSHRLEYHQDRELAIAQQFDDLLYCDSAQKIFECTYSNIFFLETNHLITPPADGRIFNGRKRLQIIEFCKANKIEVSEISLTLSNCAQFESCFACNAVMGVMPVLEIEGIKHFNLENKLLKALSSHFNT